MLTKEKNKCPQPHSSPPPPAGTLVRASSFAWLAAVVGVVFALTFLPQAVAAQVPTVGVQNVHLEELRVYHGATATAANQLTYTPTLATATRIQGELSADNFAAGGGEFHFSMTAPHDATQVTVQGRNTVICLGFLDEDRSSLLAVGTQLCAEPFTTDAVTLAATGNTVLIIEANISGYAYHITGASDHIAHIVLNIAKAVSPPTMPTGVMATAGDASIDVSWTAGTGTTPSGYTVCALARANADPVTSVDYDSLCTDTFITTATATEVTLTSDNITNGINNDTSYAIGVRADHATADSSAWAAPSVNPVTPVASMDATLASLSFTHGITLSPAFSADELMYTVSVGFDTTTFRVTATANHDKATAVVTVPATSMATATNGLIINLPVGETAITITVTASDGTTRDYVLTVTREQEPAPDVPTGITATAGDASIVVTWVAPASGTTPEGFTVCGYAGGASAVFDDLDGNCGATTQVSVTGADTLTATLDAVTFGEGITNGTAYWIGVRSDHATAGNSAWANLADATMNPVTPMMAVPPGVPTGVTATAGNAAITYAWDAPASGTTPTGYTVCFIAGSDTALITETACTGDATTTAGATDTGITIGAGDGFTIANDTAYVVGVRADHDTAGNSGWGTAGPVTPVAPVPPGVPSGVTINPIFITTTTPLTPPSVSWTAPVGGVTPTGYEVCLLDFATTGDTFDGANCTAGYTTAVADATATSASLNAADFSTINAGGGIFTDVNYFIAVRATTADAASDWVASAQFMFTQRAATTTATLSALTLSDVTFTPDFVADSTTDLAYTADVAATVTTTTVTAAATDDNATVAITSDMDSTIGANGAVDLAVGANVITITVTAEDTTTTQAYTVTVTRETPPLSSDATLSSLMIYEGATATGTALTLSPAFSATTGQDAATVEYDAGTVPNATTQVTIVIAPTDAGATMATDEGTAVTSPYVHTLNTNILDTSILIIVTATDGTTKEFDILVTREAATGTPTPTLPTLTIAAVSATVTEGTDANVSFTVTSDAAAPAGGLAVTVTLTGGDAFVDAAERTQSATIAEGATTATVNFPISNNDDDEADASVTATIGDSDAYEGDGNSVTAMILDDDEPAEEVPTAFSFAAQSDLEPGVETSAAVTVAGLSASSVVVTVTTTVGSVSINGGAAATTGMASNGDTVTATVTSGACGTSVTATVSIGGGRADFVVTTRACNTDATLSALALTGVTLTPAFAPETLAYTAEVESTVATTTVTATATDAPRASVAGDGVVNLAGGTNNIVITVTAEDGSTREYTVRIARDRLPTASADATPNPVNPGGTVTLTGTGADADGNNPATAYAWACAYDDANLPLPACVVTGDTAATASYAAPTMEELDELEIAGAIAITFTLTVTFTNGETPSDQTTVTLRSQNREMVMAAGVVSLGAIDRSIAQQSTGLIAQRFNANIATPTGTGGGGGESSQLVNNLKRALTPNARDNVAQATDAPEKLSHTAPAPGSLEARYEGADNWQRLHTDDINLLNILEKNPVTFSLGDGDGIGGEFGVWFAATHSDISGAPVADGTRTAYDGRATTLQAGIDQSFNDGALLLGLALSWNTSDVDFTATNAVNASRTPGNIERTGVTIHPYLSWRANPRTSLWLLGGFGDGDYTVTLTDAGLGGKSDASQLLLAGGVESTLTQSANFEALMRGGAFLSRSEVDASGDVLAFESDSWQVQGEVEAARVSTGEGRTLRQYLLGIARAQGGDDLSNGAAFGLGFGVKGNLSARGLSFDVGARVEAAETTDLDEERALWKTIYGALRYDAGDDGRGVVVSVGQGMSQVLKSSWRTGAFEDVDAGALSAAPGMQATVGYGWGARLAGRAGVLTAFGELVAAEQALGLRFEAERFELRLETRERELERRTQLRLEMDF